MTGLLEDLLARKAAAVDPPALDLDRVVADGDRRIRRRRGWGLAVTAAVMAGVVAIAWSVVRVDRSAGPADAPFRDRRPTYATGSTIHYGDTTIEVRHPIRALAQTDAAFVITTPSAEVFLADGKHVVKIGTSAERLVADDTGPYVGWVDSDSYVVYDTAARRAVMRGDIGPSDVRPAVVAIDDGNVYVVGADGLHRRNLSDNTDDLVGPGVNPDHVLDVAAGRYAILALPNPYGRMFVTSTDPMADEPVLLGATADLSPDGSVVVARTGDASPPLPVGQRRRVYAIGSRHKITIGHPGYAALGLTAWLDNDRFTAWGVRNDRIDLLSCSIASAGCTVAEAAVAGGVIDGTDPGLRLPNGQPGFDVTG